MSAAQCRFCGTFGTDGHRCPTREIPVVPMAIAPPSEPNDTPRRPPSLGDPERDMELLAKHLPTIVGSALDPEPKVASGKALSGRPDRVDERHMELDAACITLRRLATMEWKARLVLVYAYLVCGIEARQRSAGFAARLGLVFATRSQRMAWLTQPAKSMGMSAATRLGEGLLKISVQAYAAIKGDLPLDDGMWLSTAIDQVTRMDSVASGDTRTFVRVRETNRISQQKSPNRQARRSVLRHDKAHAK